MSILDTIEVMLAHQKAILALEKSTECDCPVEVDPYGTGDVWFKIRRCQRVVCVDDDDDGVVEDSDTTTYDDPNGHAASVQLEREKTPIRAASLGATGEH